MIEQVERVHALAFRRSAFQVALLMFATFGLYLFVWAFFIRRACASLLEQEDQPIWKSVALIVPVFNFFLMFDLGKKIQGVQWRADPARVDGWLPWIGVSVFAFTVVGRLKGPVSNLGLLDFVPIVLMQLRFVRAQIALLGEPGVPTRLHWVEWIAVGLGAVLWILITFEIAMPVRSHPVVLDAQRWFVACMALAVAALVAFGVNEPPRDRARPRDARRPVAQPDRPLRLACVSVLTRRRHRAGRAGAAGTSRFHARLRAPRRRHVVRPSPRPRAAAAEAPPRRPRAGSCPSASRTHTVHRAQTRPARKRAHGRRLPRLSCG